MIYTRENLIRPVGGIHWWECALCLRANTTPNEITHREDCPLADSTVELLRVEPEPRVCSMCGAEIKQLVCTCANNL